MPLSGRRCEGLMSWRHRSVNASALTSYDRKTVRL